MSEMERLQRENAELKAQLDATSKGRQTVRLGIGEKGGVKVQLGTRRFPVTLYPSEWLLILQHADELKDFIKDNSRKLSWKKDGSGSTE